MIAAPVITAAGSEIHKRFTCKQKLLKDKLVGKKPEVTIATGIKRDEDIDWVIVK